MKIVNVLESMRIQIGEKKNQKQQNKREVNICENGSIEIKWFSI